MDSNLYSAIVWRLNIAENYFSQLRESSLPKCIEFDSDSRVLAVISGVEFLYYYFFHS